MDPDQTSQNMVSDQVLHCLLTELTIKTSMRFLGKGKQGGPRSDATDQGIFL